MNPYIKNLNRIEFLITLACTGRCKHCSEGDHDGCHTAIDADAAASLVTKVAENYNIQSLMTFGGEPMLHPETVYAIHRAARDAGIPKRQLITNGFFSRDERKIRTAAEMGTKPWSQRLTPDGVSAPAPPQDAPLRGVAGSPGGSRHSDTGLREGRVSVLPPWASVSPFENQRAAIFFLEDSSLFPKPLMGLLQDTHRLSGTQMRQRKAE